MRTIPIEQVEGHLAEILENMPAGDEVIITRADKHIARLVSGGSERPRPVPGRGKGMVSILSDDEEHLKDFTEHLP